MNAYRNASFAGAVIFLIGIVISVYGFSFLLRQNDLKAHGIPAKGTVFEIEEKAIYRSPWVRFTP